MTNDGIVGASEDECLDIGIKCAQIGLEMGDDFGIVVSALLDEWDESWSGDLLDRDGIVVEVNPFFVGFIPDAWFCREDADFAVPCLDDFLGSGDSDAEDLTIRKPNLLEVPDRVSGCRVAREDDDGGTGIEEELDSFFSVLPDSRVVEISVRTSRTIPEIQIIVPR